GDLNHRVPFEIVTETGFTHHGLLTSNLGKKASTNLGAIQSPLLISPLASTSSLLALAASSSNWLILKP
ncbi:MAG: hypothetical protein O3A94_16895, partial [Proteobacteria bacterium]|nr:hypothetical protein [Pseudomonadota bacterium]